MIVGLLAGFALSQLIQHACAGLLRDVVQKCDVYLLPGLTTYAYRPFTSGGVTIMMINPARTLWKSRVVRLSIHQNFADWRANLHVGKPSGYVILIQHCRRRCNQWISKRCSLNRRGGSVRARIAGISALEIEPWRCSIHCAEL